MQAYWILLRRELGSYFVSMTGYVIMASVLLLLGISFTVMLDSLNLQPTDMPVTELFYSTPFFWLILLLAVPLVTMRTFALEKYSGTVETLMTAPLSDMAVVLAKFTGAFIFYVLMWLPLLACIFIVNHYTENQEMLDAGVIASSFLGILLLGCLFTSLGCFASALTRSQIIAAIISFALGMALFLLSFLSFIEVPEPGWQTETFQYISLIEHMQDFARGVVDTRPIVFYLSLTFLFLFLTLRVIESRRWK